MSNIVLQLLTWGAFALHLAIGLVARRRGSGLPLVPLVNLLVGLSVVAFWAQRWVGYVTQGITWYWSDQLFPLYALGVCILSLLGLAGVMSAAWPHWTIFAVHTLVLLAAALFATFVRFGAGI